MFRYDFRTQKVQTVCLIYRADLKTVSNFLICQSILRNCNSNILLPTYTLAGQLPSPCVDDDGSLTYVQPWHMSFKTSQLPNSDGIIPLRYKEDSSYALVIISGARRYIFSIAWREVLIDQIKRGGLIVLEVVEPRCYHDIPGQCDCALVLTLLRLVSQT